MALTTPLTYFFSLIFQSLGILASIPAAILILALVGLLLYLLTRCCDRKSRKAKSQACQKCTLITTTLFCCAAIGLGLYGNDDFHNGILQAHGSGKQIVAMLANFTNRVSGIVLLVLDYLTNWTFIYVCLHR